MSLETCNTTLQLYNVIFFVGKCPRAGSIPSNQNRAQILILCSKNGTLHAKIYYCWARFWTILGGQPLRAYIYEITYGMCHGQNRHTNIQMEIDNKQNSIKVVEVQLVDMFNLSI